MPISLSQVLSVILALAVVYYTLALIVSAITKSIVDAFDTKGKSLEGFLKKNLLGVAEGGKSVLLEQLKQMPQLSSLKPVRYARKSIKLPLLPEFGLPVGFIKGETEIINYVERIPPKNLVDALFDMAGTIENGNERVKQIISLLPEKLPGIDGPQEFKARTELLKFAGDKFDDVDALRAKMETWFTGLMDQASQEFKAKAQRIALILSLVVVFVFGVDSIELAKLYWSNAALSATANAQASLIASKSLDF
ncbi:MAG: hypothetical protein WA821_16525 [Anaerolineales bacterium]